MWHYDSDSDIVTILYSWVRLSTTTTTSTAGLMFSKWRCNIQDLLQWIENYTFCWITTKSMFTLLSWISYSEFQTFCETINVVVQSTIQPFTYIPDTQPWGGLRSSGICDIFRCECTHISILFWHSVKLISLELPWFDPSLKIYILSIC